ncbi:MAG: IS21 family transposase, partial [Planctomycetes bacterium]|nr:IS21 family transposase [Planctomycetota bacterium]
TFLDLDDCRRRALVWCTDKAGRRPHGTTRRRPMVVFEEEEKPHLKLRSPVPFDPPSWGMVKVHPDHCVRLLQALYTVPTRLVGKTVQVRADSKLVRIYVGTEVVKTHPRQKRGGRSLDPEDYPKEKTPYTLRDPAYQVRRAKERGPPVGRFRERLLDGSFPWSKLRLAQKLLRLAETYGARRLDAACQRALEYDLVDISRVEWILKHALDEEPYVVQRVFAFSLRGHFVREPRSFVHEQEVSDGSLA